MTDRLAEGRWIGISGAIPTWNELEKHGWNERHTREAVQRIGARILLEGGGLIHGSHPTFTSLIKWVADKDRDPGEGKRVRIFASMFFYGPRASGDAAGEFDPVTGQFNPEVSEVEFRTEHEPYAAVTMTGSPDMGRLRKDLGPALTDMRRAMLAQCDALVCIGGRLEGASLTPVPGVKEEFDMACDRGIPVYLVGTGGGCALRLFEDLGEHVARLHNGLTAERNRHLATDATSWEAASLIAEDLVRIGLLKAPAVASAAIPLAGPRAGLAADTAPMPDVPPAPAKPALDVNHLNMIQGVVNRLAGNSFTIKGWSVTLVAALLGLAVNNVNPWLAMIALIPAIAFWLLDAYYLMLERRYRKLFTTVVKEATKPLGDRRIPPFSLDAALVKDEVENLIQTAFGLNRKDHTQNDRKPLRLAVVGTHLPLVITVVLVQCLIGFGVIKPKDPDKPPPGEPASSTMIVKVTPSDSRTLAWSAS